MDITKLTQGQKIAAGSAILLFIVMFFSWFGAPENEVTGALEAAGADTSANAWQSFDFIDLILLLTIVVAVGAAVIVASGSGGQRADPARRPVDPARWALRRSSSFTGSSIRPSERATASSASSSA